MATIEIGAKTIFLPFGCVKIEKIIVVCYSRQRGKSRRGEREGARTDKQKLV